jgi:hypothetical protein
MSTHKRQSTGRLILSELQEFGSFTPAEQRYVRRSLDVAYARSDAISLWSRDHMEAASIKVQTCIYEDLGTLRSQLPNGFGVDNLDQFMGTLIVISAFDLAQNRISSFGAYRFLYERLLGANARRWLPAAFCAAAALPHLQPTKRRELLQSISEAAATAPGWSGQEPTFFPEWVEKEVVF